MSRLLLVIVVSLLALLDYGRTDEMSSCQLESGQCTYNVKLAPMSSCGNGDEGRAIQRVEELSTDVQENSKNGMKQSLRLDLQDTRMNKFENTLNELLQATSSSNQPCCNATELADLQAKLAESEQQISDLQKGLLAKQAEVNQLNNELQNKSQELDHCLSTRYKGYPESCKQYLEWGLADGDGFYRIQPSCANHSFVVYCDMTSNGGGWTRLFYKNGAKTCYNDFNKWTKQLVECMGIPSGDFGASASLTTLSVDQSWLFMNASWTTAEAMKNVFNCKTPTNTAWSDGYRDGFMRVGGKLTTNGGWTSMYVGCRWNSIFEVGKGASFRIGGGISHTGEFLHTSCNGYRINHQNSITSRWSDPNVRSVWYR